jgi:Ran GTPase-activating protein (RanGAP) involved in mRNA processing and transport
MPESKQKELGSLPPRPDEATKSNPASESLASKCVNIITKNFTKLPVLDKVPKKYRPQLVAQLPTDIDEKISAQNIHSEDYWRKCCEEGKGWKNCDLSQHGFTWKQLYFERHLEEMLEGFSRGSGNGGSAVAGSVDIDELLRRIEAAKDYIFGLTIKQFLSHEDLSILFDNLPNFSRLELTYGVKRLRLRFDRSLFGMKLTDAESLGRCIAKTQTLSSLALPQNLLDDDLLEILIKGLKANRTITRLDLSHNKITDLGAQLVAEMLGKSSVLMDLNLADNQIHSEGGRLLGMALNGNESLTALNVRLNRLGDVGGSALLRNLLENRTLSALNVSSNSLGYESSTALVELLGFKESMLETIDCSANDITEEDCMEIVKSFTSNRKIINFDLRRNMVGEESDVYRALDKIARRNEISKRDVWMKSAK